MSYDIHFPDDSPETRIIDAIVLRDHLSPEEVVRRALTGMAPGPMARPPVRKRRPRLVDPLSDAELDRLRALSPLFGLLEDIPEERIDQMAATIRTMKREGLRSRG